MYIFFTLIGDFDGLYFNYWIVINKFLKNKSLSFLLVHIFYVLKIHSTAVCSFNIFYRCNPLYAFMTFYPSVYRPLVCFSLTIKPFNPDITVFDYS